MPSEFLRSFGVEHLEGSVQKPVRLQESKTSPLAGLEQNEGINRMYDHVEANMRRASAKEPARYGFLKDLSRDQFTRLIRETEGTFAKIDNGEIRGHRSSVSSPDSKTTFTMYKPNEFYKLVISRRIEGQREMTQVTYTLSPKNGLEHSEYKNVSEHNVPSAINEFEARVNATLLTSKEKKAWATLKNMDWLKAHIGSRMYSDLAATRQNPGSKKARQATKKLLQIAKPTPPGIAQSVRRYGRELDLLVSGEQIKEGSTINEVFLIAEDRLEFKQFCSRLNLPSVKPGEPLEVKRARKKKVKKELSKKIKSNPAQASAVARHVQRSWDNNSRDPMLESFDRDMLNSTFASRGIHGTAVFRNNKGS